MPITTTATKQHLEIAGIEPSSLLETRALPIMCQRSIYRAGAGRGNMQQNRSEAVCLSPSINARSFAATQGVNADDISCDFGPKDFDFAHSRHTFSMEDGVLPKPCRHEPTSATQCLVPSGQSTDSFVTDFTFSAPLDANARIRQQPDPEEFMQFLSSSNLSSFTLRPLAWRLTAALMAAGALLASSPASAAPGPKSTDLTQVDENWEVQVGTPNSSLGSPQMTFLISPTGDTNGYYAVLTVNQRDGAVGGLQLTLYNGETAISGASQTYSDTSALATSGEKFSWTTSMSIDNNGSTLTVSVSKLNSSTWGNNNQSFLTVSAPVSGLNFLNSYDLTGGLTAANSGVDYGNQRVTKITIKSITPYYGNHKSPGSDSLSGQTKQVYP